MNDAGDNLLRVENGESWNKARQREHMQQKAMVQVAAEFMTIPGSPSDREMAIPLTTLVSLAPISEDELQKARLTPRCILPDLLYADVRTQSPQGGPGKRLLRCLRQ